MDGGADRQQAIPLHTNHPRTAESGGMQLVSRVAAVLRALEGASVGLTLGQIAKSTDLPRATVQRIVDALSLEQLVAADPVHGGVRLGPALIRMASSAYSDFRLIARPHLEALSTKLCETVVLTALRDWRAAYVDHVIADRPIQVTAKPGTEMSLHSTAAGKALLAHLPDETVRRLVGGKLERLTAKTVWSVPLLRAQIADVARTGFAYDDEESVEGISAIATPVRDALGTYYSISITVPTPRFSAGLERFRAELAECRRRIEASAGATGLACTDSPSAFLDGMSSLAEPAG